MSDTEFFTREQWFKLPLKLRQRWLRETDYGLNEPSVELRSDVLGALLKLSVSDTELGAS